MYGNWPVLRKGSYTLTRQTRDDPATVTTGTSIRQNIANGRGGSKTPGYATLRRQFLAGLISEPFLYPLQFQRELNVQEPWFGEDVDLYNPPITVLVNNYMLSGYVDSVIWRRTSVPTTVPDSEFPDLRAEVDQKARLQIKAQQYNLAEMLATRKDTADLIGNTAKRIAACFMALRKANFPAAAKAIGMKLSRTEYKRVRGKWRRRIKSGTDPFVLASEQFLAWEYGWAPLLSDCYTALERSNEQIPIPLVKVVAKKKVEVRGSVFQLNENFGTRGMSRWEGYSFHKVVCYYRVDDFNTGRTLTQLGISNPALLAWELVPFSFVVDWFLPIGNWISSWDATMGTKFHSGCRTNVRAADLTATEVGGYYSTYRHMYRSITAKSKRYRMDRTVLYSFPSISVPTFKSPFSTKHCADALALLVTAFKR